MSKDFKLVDIKGENFSDKVLNELEKDVRKFALEYSNKFFLKNTCPACNSKNINYYFTCWDMKYSNCNKCKTIFTNPCPEIEEIIVFLNTSEGLRIWREEMPLSLQKSREKLYEERANLVSIEINKLNIKYPSILEIGGGRGEFSNKLHDLNLFKDIHVVEPQELHLDHKNIHTYRCSFEELNLDTKVDCIVSFEVLEHLIDPIKFLTKSYELLNEGGILVLSTPNGDSLEVNLRKNKSTQVNFDHIRLYNPMALNIMLENIGSWEINISTPGLFDVAYIEKNLHLIDSATKDCLKYIFAQKNGKDSFQDYLIKNKKSSHMLCIAKKK